MIRSRYVAYESRKANTKRFGPTKANRIRKRGPRLGREERWVPRVAGHRLCGMKASEMKLALTRGRKVCVVSSTHVEVCVKRLMHLEFLLKPPR